MTHEEDVMKELKHIKDGVHGNSLAAARIEGDIKLHTSQIERNTDDIAKNDESRRDSDRRLHNRIEKVDGKLNKIVVRVATAATAAGAAAGGAINAVMNRINGG